MQRKKLNKQKREQLKAEKANEFNKTFDYAWKLGYIQGAKDKEKELNK